MKIFTLIISLILINHTHIISQTLNQKLKLAQQLESTGRLNEARQFYEQMFSEQPNNIVIFNRLRDLYLNQHEYELAKTLIENRLVKHPQQLDLHIYLGQIHYRMGDDKKAYQIWEKAVQQHKKEQRVYHMLSSILIQERLLERAIETYEKGRKVAGKPELYAINLASLYLTNRDYEKSISEYLTYYLQYPKQIKYIESQISRFPVHPKVMSDIEKPMLSAIEQAKNPAALEMLLVKLYVKNDDFRKALKFAKIIDAKSDSALQGRALFEFAKEAFTKGRVKEAKSAYGEIFTTYPHFNGMDQVMLGLAQCEESVANFEDAIQAYRDLLNYPASVALKQHAWLQIGNLQRDKLFQIDDAISTYEDFLKKYPRSKSANIAKLELGQCYTLNGDLEKSSKQLQQCIAQNPQDLEQIQTVYYLAQVHYFNADYKKALSLLDSLAGLKMSSQLYQHPAINDALKLRLFIQTWQKDDPIALQHFSKTDLLITQRKLKEAQSALDGLIMLREKAPISAEAWFRKGEVSESQKEFGDAIRFYTMVSDSFPQFILADKALSKCGQLYELKNKPDDAIFIYEILLTTYPHSLLTPEIRKRLRLLQE